MNTTIENVSDPKAMGGLIEAFHNDVKANIEKNVRKLILQYTKDNGARTIVRMKEDSYLGFPRVYSDDGHCSIVELKSVSVHASGRLRLSTDEHTKIASPHFENLSIGELLQIWEIVIKSIANK